MQAPLKGGRKHWWHPEVPLSSYRAMVKFGITFCTIIVIIIIIIIIIIILRLHAVLLIISTKK